MEGEGREFCKRKGKKGIMKRAIGRGLDRRSKYNIGRKEICVREIIRVRFIWGRGGSLKDQCIEVWNKWGLNEGGVPWGGHVEWSRV